MVPGPYCRSPCRHAQNDDRRTRAQTAHRTLALCHHWRDAGGRRLTSSGLKGVTGTSITTELFGARAGFSAHCRIDDPRWRDAVIRTGSDADRKIGPAARSFAADAHDCIMVRTSTNLPNTSLRREIRLNRELPSDLTVPPRAQASRRCQTQAPLGGKAPSFAKRFAPLTPLRALQEPDRRRRDEERPLQPPNKELAINRKTPLDRESPIQGSIQSCRTESPGWGGFFILMVWLPTLVILD